MSRSGYVDACGDILALRRWWAQVKSATESKAGQAFLRELAQEMDAMPEKVLIAGELINSDGDCCTIGVVCKSRGLDVSSIDINEPKQVGAAVGIARQMAAEIEHINDECGYVRNETPQERWTRMRKWVQSQIVSQPADANGEDSGAT